MRLAQTRSNDIEPLFVATRSKPETGFPNPFLRSYMLRTCARKPRAGTARLPLSPLSGKISCDFGVNTFPDGAKRIPISRSSGDLE